MELTYVSNLLHTECRPIDTYESPGWIVTTSSIVSRHNIIDLRFVLQVSNSPITSLGVNECINPPVLFIEKLLAYNLGAYFLR
jgi:hypothetical protein